MAGTDTGGAGRAGGTGGAGAGLPESVVPAEVWDRLPASSPPPPWRLPVRAVLWLSRGAPPGLRGLPVTVGAVVDYRDSPVGPYREVFAATLLGRVGPPAVHVPFIAVDSLPSLRAGRAHWGLPKALAGFTGTVGERVRATGDGWAVEVAARPYGPVLPAAGLVVAVQDGRRTLVTVRGTARPARVEVTAAGPTLAGWLGRGRHLGVVVRGRIHVRAARPEVTRSRPS